MPKRRAKAFLLDSDFSGTEVDFSIESGFTKIDVDKKNKFEFFVDRTRPIKIFRNGLLSKEVADFYLFSWKSLTPLEFELRQELWKRDELYEKMRNANYTEEEIEKLQKEVDKKEKEGHNMDYLVFKTLEPIPVTKDHWAKTELPAIMRDTVDMRFLKSLKTYMEGGKGGGLGKGLIIIFAVVFILLVILYAMIQNGVFKPAG